MSALPLSNVESLASIKHMFGSEIDAERVPILIQAGLDCLDMNMADNFGVKMSADEIEMATIAAHERVISLLDSVSVALVSLAAVTATVDMPESSRTALESIIQLNVAQLEDKFF